MMRPSRDARVCNVCGFSKTQLTPPPDEQPSRPIATCSKARAEEIPKETFDEAVKSSAASQKEIDAFADKYGLPEEPREALAQLMCWEFMHGRQSIVRSADWRRVCPECGDTGIVRIPPTGAPDDGGDEIPCTSCNALDRAGYFADEAALAEIDNTVRLIERSDMNQANWHLWRNAALRLATACRDAGLVSR